MTRFRKYDYPLLVGLLLWAVLPHLSAKVLKVVYVSDLHYGLTRTFRGEKDVPAFRVNRVMIERINALPAEKFPNDGGVEAGAAIGGIDFIANTGDIASRMENGVQSSAVSWKQYQSDWDSLLHVTDALGHCTPVYLSPGNHDVSNAIGFHRPMKPKNDATCLAAIYNLMMHPADSVTAARYDYTTQKVRYSFTREGVHFIFAGIWPDTETRKWMEEDMKKVAVDTPVLIFAHDPAAGVMKHFRNPNGRYDINPWDKFENLLVDMPEEKSVKDKPVAECRKWIDFVKTHSGIKAYFHGHTNYSQFYNLKDENGKQVLPVFRVDSPMKGEISSTDESKLSLMVICIDTDQQLLTAREYLWNNPETHWGESKTISIR